MKQRYFAISSPALDSKYFNIFLDLLVLSVFEYRILNWIVSILKVILFYFNIQLNSKKKKKKKKKKKNKKKKEEEERKRKRKMKKNLESNKRFFVKDGFEW